MYKMIHDTPILLRAARKGNITAFNMKLPAAAFIVKRYFCTFPVSRKYVCVWLNGFTFF